MSDYTSKLNLYKVDPAIDGEDTFNIKSMMNDNWDKIDEKVGNMDEKLSGVEDNANNYNHPDTHDAEMIRIKDESGKFTGDNVEDALGEVGSQLGDIAYKQGNLTTLITTEKTNLVGAINEVFQFGNNIKNIMVAKLLSIDNSLPLNGNSSWGNICNQLENIKSAKRTQLRVHVPENTGSYYVSANVGYDPDIIIAKHYNGISDGNGIVNGSFILYFNKPNGFEDLNSYCLSYNNPRYDQNENYSVTIEYNKITKKIVIYSASKSYGEIYHDIKLQNIYFEFIKF
ncbi:hypothetical protein [Vallitalea guaymasensis]|uniref:hypothetical protein n=1 Tax=Vallitalea guaymasensis TaxID=1185412 RepID=UPI000DE2C418|nr:hypothetical protein [Vallitalea guaymasensis]